ncbi:MAG: carbohydrate ABC transporter permease [Acholeplasmataceae bacterium]
MKRIPKKLRLFDIIATLLDWVYVFIGLYIVYGLFQLYIVPEDITQLVDTTYRFMGFDITTAQVNRLISLLIGYLIIFIPTAVVNTKRLRSKELVEIDEWTYRTQYLYAFMSLLTFNYIASALRVMVAIGIQNIYVGYGFKQSVINISKFVLSLFKKETYQEMRKKRLLKKEQSASQQDLDRVNTIEFFKTVLRLVITYSFLTLIALFIFIPFYWMILTALKTNQELTESLNPRFFIGLSEMQWVNFKIALTRFDFLQYIWNTIFVGIVSTIGTLITTVLAAFAFARLDFKGRDFIFSVLLMTMMIPGELYTITNYITVSRLGWINSFYALIVPFMTSVFYIFFLRQAFKQISDSLYRAAQVDGCSDFKYLSRVMIPIAKPTIITITILSSIGAWDAYIWPQLVVTERRYWLISVALRGTSFALGSGSDARPLYNLQLAATALVTAPLLIIFFSLKKYIMAGVGRSGTKG